MFERIVSRLIELSRRLDVDLIGNGNEDGSPKTVKHSKMPD
jgi:hypothetical protein